MASREYDDYWHIPQTLGMYFLYCVDEYLVLLHMAGVYYGRYVFLLYCNEKKKRFKDTEGMTLVAKQQPFSLPCQIQQLAQWPHACKFEAVSKPSNVTPWSAPLMRYKWLSDGWSGWLDGSFTGLPPPGDRASRCVCDQEWAVFNSCNITLT